jgi:hypothetical protein
MGEAAIKLALFAEGLFSSRRIPNILHYVLSSSYTFSKGKVLQQVRK